MTYLLGLVFGNFNLLPIRHLFQPSIWFTDRYLHTFIGHIRGYFEHSDVATDPKLNNLYDAIVTTIKILSDAYDDEEVKAFLEKRPFR